MRLRLRHFRKFHVELPVDRFAVIDAHFLVDANLFVTSIDDRRVQLVFIRAPTFILRVILLINCFSISKQLFDLYA